MGQGFLKRADIIDENETKYLTLIPSTRETESEGPRFCYFRPEMIDRESSIGAV